MQNPLENIDTLPDRAVGEWISGHFYKDQIFPGMAFRFVGVDGKPGWEAYHVLKQQIPDEESFVGDNGVHVIAELIARDLARFSGSTEWINYTFEAYTLLTTVYHELLMKVGPNEDHMEYLRRVIYGERS